MKKVLIILGVIVLIIAGLGFYKFNILQDDIFVENKNGEIVQYSEYEKGLERNDLNVISTLIYVSGKFNLKTDIYNIDIALPIFSNKVAEQDIKNWIDVYVFQFKEFADKSVSPDSDFFQPWLLEISYKIKESKNVLTYIIEGYEYRGGAHGNAIYQTFSYSKETGEKIETINIISDIDSLATFAAFADKEFSQNEIGYWPDGASAKLENWANWYTDDSSITFIFSPYSIAPYAAGFQEINIVTVGGNVGIFNQSYFMAE